MKMHSLLQNSERDQSFYANQFYPFEYKKTFVKVSAIIGSFQIIIKMLNNLL